MPKPWLHRIGVLAGAALLAFPGHAARAAEAFPDSLSDDRRWSIIVSPYIWAASLTGDGSLAGFNTAVDVPFSDVVDHLDFALMGNVELTNGQWGVYIDGQHVRASQEESLFEHQIGLGITTTTITVGGFFRMYDRYLGGETAFGRPRRLGIEPTFGVRWNRLKADVSVLGFGTSKASEWTDPFVGVRANADLTERWNLFAEADIGGFGVGSELSVNAQAYLGYRTTMFGLPTTLRAGYRYLWNDYEADDFTGNKFNWDVSQHGPVVGFSVRF
ncbi:MAG TPA: hypothetical protein VNS34_03875 [Rhizobiaceae bacterium]|nr:hypothetical protein [Rhizobiaceae bacterium]